MRLMLMVEKPVVNGAQLLDTLLATGTGEDKVTLPRQLLGFIHRKEKRIATANEVLQALEKGGAPDLTLEKARQIAETGAWVGAAKDAELPIEKLLLAGAELPPEPEPPALDVMGDEPDPGECEELSPLAAKKVAKPKAADPKPKGKPGRPRKESLAPVEPALETATA